MLISFFSNEKFAYINLHAEQSFRSEEFLNLNDINREEYKNNKYNILKKSEFGVYCKVLKVDVIKEIEKNLEHIKECSLQKKFSTIIFDLSGITLIQPNMEGKFQSIFSKILEYKIEIVIINANKNLNTFINECVKGIQKLETTDYKDEFVYFLSYSKVLEAQLESFKVENCIISELFNEVFTAELKKCCDKSIESHDSSPIYTTTYINIKKCIETISFFPFVVYKLAELVVSDEIINEKMKKNEEIKFFCHTLNGSYIASLLSKLLYMDITFFDHIGPRNKIIRSFFNKNIKSNTSYIVVVDVICLGSELRAVNTLIEFLGAKSIGAISIVNCKTVKKLKDKIKRYSIIELEKTYNPLQYYISTDLELERGKKVE